MTGMAREELLWESRENISSQYRSRATETIFMALDTRLVSVDRSVPVSITLGGAVHHRLPTFLSQQQHRGPPLPYLEQHSESSVGFSHLGGEKGEGGNGLGTTIQCFAL